MGGTQPKDGYKHRGQVDFIRRGSVYHQASPEEVEAIIDVTRTIGGVSREVLDLDERDIFIPPKQPTPSVILRKDMMAKQRSRISL